MTKRRLPIALAIALAASLGLNAVMLYAVFQPRNGAGSGMPCDQARNETSNKQATRAFAEAHDGSLADTHDFLHASDYTLRNIHSSGGELTFVYTADVYRSTCGWHLPGIDGSIVQVTTNFSGEPKVVRVE